MISLISRGLVPALIAGAAAAVIPAGAGAAPIGAAAKNVSAPSEVVKVHTRKHKHYGRYYERHVDAPFAHVETGRHTVVDAPFTTVYVGRHGRYVRAPFVNLWIPR